MMRVFMFKVWSTVTEKRK